MTVCQLILGPGVVFAHRAHFRHSAVVFDLREDRGVDGLDAPEVLELQGIVMGAISPCAKDRPVVEGRGDGLASLLLQRFQEGLESRSLH